MRSVRYIAARAQRLPGLRYGLRILMGGALAWLLLERVGRTDPLWAMISVVVVTDREVDAAVRAFRSRLMNTLIGCGVGLTMLFCFGRSIFTILFAMAAAVVISSDVVKVPVSWRIAPITVAIVMVPAVMNNSAKVAEYNALMRTGEVLLGSAIAVFVTYATSWAFHHFDLRKSGGDDEPEPPVDAQNIDE